MQRGVKWMDEGPSAEGLAFCKSMFIRALGQKVKHKEIGGKGTGGP